MSQEAIQRFMQLLQHPETRTMTQGLGQNTGNFAGPAMAAAGSAANLANPNAGDFSKGLSAAQLGGSALQTAGQFSDDPLTRTAGDYFGAGLGAAGSGATLASPDSPAVAKGFAAGNLASTGLQQGGSLAGSELASTVGKGLGTAAGVAATGYDIYNTATNPNLSTAQKTGHSIGDVANLGGLLSPIGPYYGAGLAARAINQHFAHSGSPEISGAAKGASEAAVPVEGLMSVLGGDTSIKGALKHMGQTFSDNPARALMGLDPVSGSIFGALGIGNYKPTEGTLFRTGLQGLYKKFGLPEFDRADKNIYNIDPKKYDAFDPGTRAAANQIAALVSQKAPTYHNQATAILLNTLTPAQIQALAKNAQ